MELKKFIILMLTLPLLSLTSCRDFNKGNCENFEYIIENEVMKIGESQSIYLATNCKRYDGPLFVFSVTNEKVLSFNEQTLTITALAEGAADLVVRFGEFPDVVQTKTIKVVSNEKPIRRGTFYGFREAYDEGLLTDEDLYVIKDEMYNKSLTIDKEIETLIKKDHYAVLQGIEVWRESGITYEDIIIINYYGEYNGSYVIVIVHANEHYPTLGILEEIGGVEFEYGLPGPIVWLKDI